MSLLQHKLVLIVSVHSFIHEYNARTLLVLIGCCGSVVAPLTVKGIIIGQLQIESSIKESLVSSVSEKINSF